MADSPDSKAPPSASVPPQPVSARTRKWTLIIIGLFVAIWCLAMLYRMEIRAYWWARQLARSTTPQEQSYYLVRLVSLKNKAKGAAVRLVRNPDPRIRELGIVVLGNCSGPQIESVLIELLNDADEHVGDAAALALTDSYRGGGAALLPRLEAILRAGGRPARHAAVALQRVPGQQAESILADALSTTDEPDLVAQIVDSLGMMGSREAIPRMIARLDDGRPVQVAPYSERAAIRALRDAGSQLAARGLDSQALLAAMPRSRTVADVALRSLQIIAGRSAPTTSTAPADERALRTLRQKWEEWWTTSGELRMRN